MELQEQIAIIEKSDREVQIAKYATECDCGFTFVPMQHYVRNGNKFCVCHECDDVILLDK